MHLYPIAQEFQTKLWASRAPFTPAFKICLCDSVMRSQVVSWDTLRFTPCSNMHLKCVSCDHLWLEGRVSDFETTYITHNKKCTYLLPNIFIQKQCAVQQPKPLHIHVYSCSNGALKGVNLKMPSSIKSFASRPSPLNFDITDFTTAITKTAPLLLKGGYYIVHPTKWPWCAICVCHKLLQITLLITSNQDCKALQRVVRLAERISGSTLPSLQDIYLKRCKSRAAKILKDSNHPGNHLFRLLPSGKRFRSMMAKTERLRRSFFPQAIRLLNTNSV